MSALILLFGCGNEQETSDRGAVQSEAPAQADSRPQPGAEQSRQSPPAVQVSTNCDAAFRNAAAIDDMHDTVEDLDPAIKACRTVAEWSAASARHPKALDGVPPEVFLRNRCDFGGLQTPLCAEILDR